MTDSAEESEYLEDSESEELSDEVSGRAILVARHGESWRIWRPKPFCGK